MGFFSKIFGAAVNIAVTPLAIIEDTGDILSGEEPIATKSTLKSSANNIITSLDNDEDDWDEDW